MVLGLSGGIDSALTLAIAVDALGAENVEVVSMPSRYTADISNIDALQQARAHGRRPPEHPIEPAFDAFSTCFRRPSPVPARYHRGEHPGTLPRVILMAISNKRGCMLLTTGNRARCRSATRPVRRHGRRVRPLKDAPKTLVYLTGALAQPRFGEVIPARHRTPARLNCVPDQKDSDSLPDYDLLDAILELYVEHDNSVDEIVGAGYPRGEVERITRLVDRNEYKRRQAPPGSKITRRAYGRDRRYPIVNGF